MDSGTDTGVEGQLKRDDRIEPIRSMFGSIPLVLRYEAIIRGACEKSR